MRWNRIENLVVESAKSGGRRPAEEGAAELWLVAQWLLGDPGAGLRKPLAAELARLLDSLVAGEGAHAFVRRVSCHFTGMVSCHSWPMHAWPWATA